MEAEIVTNGTLKFSYRFENAGEDSFISYLTVQLVNGQGRLDTPFETFDLPTGWTPSGEIDVKLPENFSEATLRFQYYGKGEVYIDGLTWTPEGAEHPEPTEADKVTISSAAILDGKFKLSFPSDKQFDYNLLTNANLSIDTWGVMMNEAGTGETVTFEPIMIEGLPQLFYKVETIRKRDE